MPSKIVNKCRNTDLNGLSQCLDEDSVNIADIWGHSPLYHAVRYKSILCMNHLIEMGANIFLLNRVCGHEEDLLVTAFRSGDFDTVKAVISLYAGTGTIEDHIQRHMTTYLPHLFRGNTVYLEAFLQGFQTYSFKGYESIFCKTAKKEHYILLARKNICYDLQNALKYTVIYRRSICFLYLLDLVRYPERLNHVYRPGLHVQQTLFSLCGINGYLKGIQNLIEAGADAGIASVNERGETRNNLMALVDNSCYSLEKPAHRCMIQKCLRLYVTIYDINAQNSRGQSALMFSKRAGNHDLTNILLELGADSNLVDMDGANADAYSESFSRRGRV
jgi:hypothetical protein